MYLFFLFFCSPSAGCKCSARPTSTPHPSPSLTRHLEADDVALVFHFEPLVVSSRSMKNMGLCDRSEERLDSEHWSSRRLRQQRRVNDYRGKTTSSTRFLGTPVLCSGPRENNSNNATAAQRDNVNKQKKKSRDRFEQEQQRPSKQTTARVFIYSGCSFSMGCVTQLSQ